MPLKRTLRKPPQSFLCFIMIAALSQYGYTPLSYIIFHPHILIHATSKSRASDRDACLKNYFFFLGRLFLFSCPVHGSGTFEGQARGKVHPNAVSSVLPWVSVLPGSCFPRRPCYRCCVPKCDTAKTPEAPPSLLTTSLLCAWPGTQGNYPTQEPHRELCLQLPHESGTH